MASDRPNPDILLAALQQAEARQQRGQLKVFLGMCAGVGKTYAMLEAARRELATGRDVLVGYLETHGRRETDALAAGLPVLPRRPVNYRGVALTEFDLDAVLARRPQLVLVDEFAHTNAPESRHPKRYQDIQELLAAGINVFTTLNIQHVESRAEAVRQITGVAVQETVPDTALAEAELELVDLPPDELRARLAAGKVYLPEQAGTARERFFRPGNLSALRELALRFAAEQVGEDVRDYRRSHGVAATWPSGQRLLVAVSASPTSASLIRWACRLAGELHASWLAVYVEPPRVLAAPEQARVTAHLALARELGAEVISTSDHDVVAGLLRVAQEQNVSQLIVGKPAEGRFWERFTGDSFLHRLIRESGNIDVHAVRAESASTPLAPSGPRLMVELAPGHDLWKALAMIAGATGVGMLLQSWTGYQAIALIYLLAAVVLGLVARRQAVFVASVLGAFLWNFLFVPPTFTLRISNAQDWMLFLTLLVVGLLVGQLTARLRTQQLAERRREQRATALYLLTRELAESPDLSQLLGVVIRQVGETFRAEVALSLPNETAPPPLVTYFASPWLLTEKEQSVATWAYQHRQSAGTGTDNLPLSEGLHLPLVVGEKPVGVLSLRFSDRAPLAPPQRDLLETFVRQVALVLDRQRLRDAEAQAQLLAESERLGKTLLNSVSHELRTPLAAITSSVSSLRTAGPLSPAQQSLAGELDEAAARLNRLVRNLLDVSRLEAGHLRANPDWHDLQDIIRSARTYLGPQLAQHPFHVELPPALPPVKLDAVLTEQILANLLGNAVMHTPAGTPVTLRVRLTEKHLVLEVLDAGPGLPPGEAGKLFERFQRGTTARAGGTGLGLSLVKGFAEAQGGTATAANRPEGGAIFTVELPRTALPPLPEDNE